MLKDSCFEAHAEIKSHEMSTSIRQLNYYYGLSHAFRENIFLTGCTGFLGAFLLKVQYIVDMHLNISKELLDSYPKSNIWCLVRSSTSEEAFQRIISCMEFYEIWQNDYRNRIIPVSNTDSCCLKT